MRGWVCLDTVSAPVQQRGVIRLGHGQQLAERQREGLVQHLLLGGKVHLAGLHLGGGDQAVSALGGAFGTALQNVGALPLGAGGVGGGDLVGLCAGVGVDAVDLRLSVGLNAAGDVFNACHKFAPSFLKMEAVLT